MHKNTILYTFTTYFSHKITIYQEGAVFASRRILLKEEEEKKSYKYLIIKTN